MSDSAVIVKTRKFKRNPLLSRRQVRCVGEHWPSLYTMKIES